MPSGARYKEVVGAFQLYANRWVVAQEEADQSAAHIIRIRIQS